MLFHRCKCPDNKTKDCSHAWQYYFEHDGRAYERSTKQTNQTKAAKVEKLALVAIIDAGTGVAGKKAPHLKAFIADYLEFARGDHPATAEDKDARILLPRAPVDPTAKPDGRRNTPRGPSFLEVVGDKRLTEIEGFDIERWRVAQLKTTIRGGRKMSRANVNRKLNVIRGLFSKAIEWKHLKVSPVPASWKLPDVEKRIATDAERILVLTKLQEPYRTLCEVTLETLMREGEALRLKRSDLGTASIQRRLKGGKVATVPVTRALIAKLRAFLVTPEQVFVFGGRALTPRSVSSQMSKAFRKAGLRGISHHSMRHTGVTDMLEAGISPKAIQRHAGWSTLRMLDTYGIARDAELQRAVQTTAARNEAAFVEAERQEAEAKAQAEQDAAEATVGAKRGASRG